MISRERARTGNQELGFGWTLFECEDRRVCTEVVKGSLKSSEVVKEQSYCRQISRSVDQKAQACEARRTFVASQRLQGTYQTSQIHLMLQYTLLHAPKDRGLKESRARARAHLPALQAMSRVRQLTADVQSKSEISSTGRPRDATLSNR